MTARLAGGCLVLFAAVIAVAGARPYAGGWNDGSRLATVECLVDYHTLAIDRSVFVTVPADGPNPYNPDDTLLRRGTGDKLFIDGQFYSDKSPVPALFLAGVYQGWQWATGWSARTHPGAFCFLLTLASSGLAYVVAVWCVYRTGLRLGLSVGASVGLAASLALATVAPVYARHVNNHILFLGVAAPLFLGLARLAEERSASAWLLLGIGALVGLGYTIDLGAGPVLVVCVAALVAYRTRSVRALVLCGLAALPWFALHHAVNYHVGGTFKPANAVPEYFLWPGCTFNPENMTGALNHKGVGRFCLYALDLLVGKHGFLGHNPALLLAVPALAVLLARRTAARPELLAAGCWAGGTWLAYALTSNNSSGQCCSIRWFVPLLAPAYYSLAIYLRERPAARREVFVLSVWGAVLAGLMWHAGPWREVRAAVFWPLFAAALLSWAGCRRWWAPPEDVKPITPPVEGQRADAA